MKLKFETVEYRKVRLDGRPIEFKVESQWNGFVKMTSPTGWIICVEETSRSGLGDLFNRIFGEPEVGKMTVVACSPSLYPILSGDRPTDPNQQYDAPKESPAP